MSLVSAFKDRQRCALRRTVLTVLGALLVAATPCTADEERLAQLKALSLESLSTLPVDTVVGASRHEQKLRDAPANVTILSNEEIKFHGWRTLGDALRSVSGMAVHYDRSYAYLGIRGFNRPGDYSGRALITVNGHRMNDAVYDSSAMGNDFLIDMDVIERIEVIRGPGSTLYGNNAFFGVVNIITRRGRDLNGTEVSGSYGTFDAYSGRLTYGNQFTNGVELMVSASLEGSDGNPRLRYPEFADQNNGVARDMDDSWSRRLFASISWKDFTFEAGFVDRFKRVPTGQYTLPESPIVFNDPRFRTYDERAFGNLKFNRTLENEWQVMARLYYDHYRYDGWYPFDYTPEDPGDPATINYDLTQSESIGSEIQFSRSFFEKHLLTLGAEARYDYQLTLINRDLNPPESYLNAHPDGYFAGVYIQDEFRLFPNLTLTGGARYDHFKVGGDTVNPRAALVYHPWEPSTIKLLYGEAYRAPNAYENYYAWPIPPQDLGLEPETVRTYEAVYEHEFGPQVRASTAFFRNELRNLITGDDQGFVNMGPATAHGIEAELQGRFRNGIQGRISYTFSDARFDEDDSRMPNAPEHLGKLNLTLPVWRQQVFWSSEIQLMSGRKTLVGRPLSGHWIANTTLFAREILPGLEGSVSVYNLFDQRYSDPATADHIQRAIPQDGRTFRVKLTYHF